MTNSTDNINVTDIEKAVFVLNKYANVASIKPLVEILEALKEDLHNESLLELLIRTWRDLGVHQGTVLTYVPHFYTWIPDDIFGDNLKEV